ncbi:MAG: cob(I)yrinic acid a,c-diamide adenosyltransferase [Anaerolineae bacterium]|nr:cob(I)yrinic acid a,c-diamide adenosyltransferase [Anaerolineae bacterium]
MPRLTKIYTRTGDDGSTSLGSKERVPKNALRVDVYGVVDELNSAIGLALAAPLSPRLAELLAPIQNQLFNLGAELAFPSEPEKEIDIPRIQAQHIEALEALIDELNEIVGPLQNFILPGGSPGAAALHLARTICRRAERLLVSLAQQETVGEQALPYLNRLSDALFVMARYENNQRGVDEPLWDPKA